MSRQRLRKEHIEKLGGIESEFGTRQMWNLRNTVSVDIEVGALIRQEQALNTIVERLIDLRAQNSDRLEIVLAAEGAKHFQILMDDTGVNLALQSDILLTPDKLVEGAIRHYREVEKTLVSVEVIEGLDSELAGALLSSMEEVEQLANGDEVLISKLRDLFANWIVKVQESETGDVESKVKTIEAVVGGFFKDFSYLSVTDVKEVEQVIGQFECRLNAIKTALPYLSVSEETTVEEGSAVGLNDEFRLK